jgi:hypothetical protein
MEGAENATIGRTSNAVLVGERTGVKAVLRHRVLPILPGEKRSALVGIGLPLLRRQLKLAAS